MTLPSDGVTALRARQSVHDSSQTILVALPLPVDECFTYSVPVGTVCPDVGCRVRVPLGRRRMVGVVVGHGHADQREASYEIRSIDAVLDPEPVLPAELLELCRWTAENYLASWGEVLASALPLRPGGPVSGRERSRRATLTDVARAAPERLLEACGRSRRRRELVEALLSARDGLETLPRDATRLLRPLLEQGLVCWRTAASPTSEAAAGSAPLVLNPRQAEAVRLLSEGLRAGRYAPFVLRGVTGSGKTEVYLRAAEVALGLGRGVIYLVPEIGLTPLLARRFLLRFGKRVAVLHSGRSQAGRDRDWRRVRSGEANVVLGARSAVFAPVVRPGLFIVDEEQEASFKQEERPRYHARDLALVRARAWSAVAVLGSATPSVESTYNARIGKYQTLELPKRIRGRPMAHAEVVDMRQEFRRRGVADPLSERLISLLKEGLQRGEQSLLLLNRRGYSTFLLCRECGTVVSCPRCSVSLVLHRAEGKLRCHHCGYWRGIPGSCPACRSKHLHWGGGGTERLEEHLRSCLAGAKLVRLDRDTVRRQGAAERILLGFERGEWDVLLGTQMIAKGHHFPRVTLVGVLAAESTLALPDFRAAERTFDLVMQVVGRAGRGDVGGRAVVQTFQPEHYAIQTACEQDYEAFYQHEIRFRRNLQHPPFTRLANLLVSGRNEECTANQAAALAQTLRQQGRSHVRVVGAAPAPLARLRGRHRFQVLVKARARGRLLDTLRAALRIHGDQGHPVRRVAVDMDPINLL